MTETQLVNLTLEAAGKTEQELPRFRILGLVTQGLELLGKRVCSQQGYQGLQKDFPATPVAGRVNLSAITDILFNTGNVEVRVASTNVGVTMVDSVKTLELAELSKDQVYCAREGDELVFRDTNGSLTAFTTAVVIKANQIPTLAGLKAQYNGALASIIAELAVGKAALPELTGASV